MSLAITNTGVIAEGATVFTFELLEEGGTASAALLPIRAGSSLRWGRRGRKIWEPVRASLLEVPLRDPNNAIASRIWGAAEDTFRIRIKRGANLYWYGKVLPDTFTASLNLYDKQHFTLGAMCGLGSLQGKPFIDPVTGLPYIERTAGSRETFVNTIAQILSLTGMGLNFVLVQNWFPHKVGGVISGQPLSTLKLDRGRFTHRTTGGDHLPPSAFDVLKQICLRYFLQIYQYNGLWHIVQRPSKLAPQNRFVYDLSGGPLAATSNVSPVAYSFPTRADAGKEWLKGGEDTRIPGLRSAAVGYVHPKASENLIKNGDFPLPHRGTEGDPKAPWVLGFGSLEEVDHYGDETGNGWIRLLRVVPELEGEIIYPVADPYTYSQTYLEQDLGTILEGEDFNLGMRIWAMRLNESGFPEVGQYAPEAAYWAVILDSSVSDSVFYLQRSGAWTTDITKMKQLVLGMGAPAGTIVSETREGGGRLVTEPTPEPGTIKFRLYQPVETQATSAGVDVGTLYVAYDDVSFTRHVEDGTGEFEQTTTVVANATSPNTEDENDEQLTLLIGDGPTEYSPGRITIGDTELTGAWKSGPYAGGEAPFEYAPGETASIDYMLAAKILRAHMESLEVHNVGLRVADVGELPPYDVIKITDEDKTFEAGEMTRYFGEMRARIGAEWIEVIDDAGWPSESAIQDAPTGFFFDPGEGLARLFFLGNKNLFNAFTSSAFTLTTGVHAAGTPHLVLDVEEITDSYSPLKAGKLIYVIDRRGMGAVLYTMRLRANVEPNATQLLVEKPDEPGVGITFPVALAPGSPVYAGEKELLAAIAITELHFTVLYKQGQICELTVSLTGGSYEQADTTPLTSDVPDNERLKIVNLDTGDEYFIRAQGAMDSGDEEIIFDDPTTSGAGVTIIAPAGSPVFFADKSIWAQFQVLAQQISAIVQSKREAEVIAELSAQVNAGTITSLPVKFVHKALVDKQIIQANDVNGVPRDFTLNGAKAASAGSTSIPIVSVAIPAALPADAPVYIPASSTAAGLLILQDEVKLFAEREQSRWVEIEANVPIGILAANVTADDDVTLTTGIPFSILTGSPIKFLEFESRTIRPGMTYPVLKTITERTLVGNHDEAVTGLKVSSNVTLLANAGGGPTIVTAGIGAVVQLGVLAYSQIQIQIERINALVAYYAKGAWFTIRTPDQNPTHVAPDGTAITSLPILATGLGHGKLLRKGEAFVIRRARDGELSQITLDADITLNSGSGSQVMTITSTKVYADIGDPGMPGAFSQAIQTASQFRWQAKLFAAKDWDGAFNETTGAITNPGTIGWAFTSVQGAGADAAITGNLYTGGVSVTKTGGITIIPASGYDVSKAITFTGYFDIYAQTSNGTVYLNAGPRSIHMSGAGLSLTASMGIFIDSGSAGLQLFGAGVYFDTGGNGMHIFDIDLNDYVEVWSAGSLQFGSGLSYNSTSKTLSATGGGGGDATTLDGYDSTAFPRKAENATITGTWTFSGVPTFSAGINLGIGDELQVGGPTTGLAIYQNATDNEYYFDGRANGEPLNIRLKDAGGTLTNVLLSSVASGVRMYHTGTLRAQTTSTGFEVIGTFTNGGNTFWHGGNDGAASGLDADLLDGFQAAAFPRLAAANTFTSTNAFSSAVTFSDQVLVNHSMKVADNVSLLIGNDGDLAIFYTSGSDVVTIDNANPSSDLWFSGRGATIGDVNTMCVMKGDAEVELYYDGVVKFETTATGISVFGSIVHSSYIEFTSIAAPTSPGASSNKARMWFDDAVKRFKYIDESGTTYTITAT